MTAASEAGPGPVGTFWMIDLERHAPGTIAPRIAAGFRRARPEDAASLASAMDLAGPAPALERFAHGSRCYVAMVDGVIAGYGWVSFDVEAISELGMSFRLAPDEAYIWDCASLPAYRGRRLYPALLSYIISELRAEGLRRVWIGADTGSLASQKGIVLAGFQPVADVFLSPGPPSVGGRPGVPEDLVRYIRRALLFNSH